MRSTILSFATRICTILLNAKCPTLLSSGCFTIILVFFLFVLLYRETHLPISPRSNAQNYFTFLKNAASIVNVTLSNCTNEGLPRSVCWDLNVSLEWKTRKDQRKRILERKGEAES